MRILQAKGVTKLRPERYENLLKRLADRREKVDACVVGEPTCARRFGDMAADSVVVRARRSERPGMRSIAN